MIRNPLASAHWWPRTTTEPTEPREEDRMYALYKSAGDLEMSLSSAVRRNPTMMLTAAQRDTFNDILQTARQMISSSRALREDIDEAGTEVDVSAAYRALHLTLVPTLHNALPDEYFAL